jgi:heme-degrading monooxygenase HmoA
MPDNVVGLCTTEDAMNARVWQMHIRRGKVASFQAILTSVVALARRQQGYRGDLTLATGKSEFPEVTLIALWDSL